MLALRGSMVMPAWAGERAREPGDLDFVVLPRLGTPPDPLDPHPYVDSFALVQEWPEALGGAAGAEIWNDGEEQYERRGIRVRVPPEGLRWEGPAEGSEDEPFPSHEDLLELIRRRPEVPGAGIVLDAERAQPDELWGYDHDCACDHVREESEGVGSYVWKPCGCVRTGGSRLHIPWHCDSGPGGRVQLDFAFDETFSEPPVWTLIPRADGGAPTVVQCASRELSLGWKLLWLHADAAAGRGPQPKDLYDAVLLAEDPRTRPAPRLLRRILRSAAPTGLASALSCDEADWAQFAAAHPYAQGTARSWTERLTARLRHLTP
ncbi:nucleotidyl transferase AbiEii/AbiGii toxin family protein [Streptomyces sp. TRM66268-LWL]|uniref:Nucleotidyl transferase AbiEii/AbiGii toxin family protein n=2 Tax=Streptomyces polyasparticus TaxID=2767826 RepID=A0ABR7SDW6_9ACTN|nr:nucleotidyl transferase AbiEii/AbiGii toxin family protein [Streptomyces polyasparticus]